MDSLTNLFQKIESLSETCDSKLKSLEETLDKHKTRTADEDHYLLMKSRYKTYIESFSPAYIQMSEYYIGPELTREKYQKIFHPTYLDSKEDIRELYKLFVFYLLIERIFGEINP